MTDVDFSDLRSLTAGKLIRALGKDGFYVETRGGAHQQFYNANDARRVTVTYHHASDIFAPKTLRSILREQAKWTQADRLLWSDAADQPLPALSCPLLVRSNAEFYITCLWIRKITK